MSSEVSGRIHHPRDCRGSFDQRRNGKKRCVFIRPPEPVAEVPHGAYVIERRFAAARVDRRSLSALDLFNLPLPPSNNVHPRPALGVHMRKRPADSPFEAHKMRMRSSVRWILRVLALPFADVVEG